MSTIAGINHCRDTKGNVKYLLGAIMNSMSLFVHPDMIKVFLWLQYIEFKDDQSNSPTRSAITLPPMMMPLKRLLEGVAAQF